MRVRTTAASVGLALALAGCGGGSSFADRSGDDVLKAASDAMLHAKSTHIVSDVTHDGQRVGEDLYGTRAGGCQGELRIGDGTSQIVSNGTHAWMKPDHAFWVEQTGRKSAAAVETVVGDKWVLLDSESDSLIKTCDLDVWLEGFKGDHSTQHMKNTGSATLEGRTVVRLAGADPRDGEPLEVWVAVQEPHYVLKIRKRRGEGRGTVALSDFDEPVDIETPAPSEVVDLSNPSG